MKYILLLIVLAGVAFGQSISVENIEQVSLKEGKYFYPKFLDDNRIVLTNSNYKGLYLFELNSEEVRTISEFDGAGYNPLIIEENNIVYRPFNIEEGRKYFSLYSYEFNTDTQNLIEEKQRRIKLPNQLVVSNNIRLVINESLVEKKLKGLKLSKTGTSSIGIYVDENNLILVKDNSKKILNPLGKGVYVWESLSADGNLITFSFGNKGSFVCDLEGNILHEIKKAHYPRFSPDNKYISFMIDEDDGYNYISSDIYIYSLETKKSYKITSTKKEIEMYAEWSPNGKQVIFNGINGDIYIATLKFEN